MGQGERTEIVNPCPQTPSSERSLESQGIKMSLNLHFRSTLKLVAVSLALILMASGPVIFLMLIPIDWPDPGWPSSWIGWPRDSEGFRLFVFANIMWITSITLVIYSCARTIPKNDLSWLLKPRTLYVVVSLIIILISGQVYWSVWYYPSVHFGLGIPWTGYDLLYFLSVFLIFSFAEIIMLRAGWKMLSGRREFNKTTTTSTLVGEERNGSKRKSREFESLSTGT